jgi:hypothetical protein
MYVPKTTVFLTHPILTHPRVPTRPVFSKCQRQSQLLFPFFILFSRKEKLIGVIDDMTQKEILRYSKGKRYWYTKEN